MALPLLVLLSAVMAVIPILMADFELWREIYAGAVMSITLATTILCAPQILGEGLLEVLLLLLLLIFGPIISLIITPPDDWVILANLMIVACYAILGHGLLGTASSSRLRIMLSILTLCQIASILHVLTIASITPDWQSWLSETREAFEFEDFNLHPNYIGLMAVVLACAGTALKFRWIRAGIAVLAFFFCWLVSSRSGELGVAAAMGTSNLLWFLSRHRNKKLPLGGALAMGIALLLIAAIFGSKLESFISNDILLLDDQYRGLDTGFTSRTDLWEIAASLWHDNPIFGVGYGQSTELMGMALYAHNMILVLLSETGLVGMTAFAVFNLRCLFNAKRALGNGHVLMGSTVIVVVVTYWVYGVFEGRAINAGNSFSALFFLLTFATPRLAAMRPPDLEPAAPNPPDPDRRSN